MLPAKPVTASAIRSLMVRDLSAAARSARSDSMFRSRVSEFAGLTLPDLSMSDVAGSPWSSALAAVVLGVVADMLS
jgi:hypothetical protein